MIDLIFLEKAAFVLLLFVLSIYVLGAVLYIFLKLLNDAEKKKKSSPLGDKE